MLLYFAGIGLGFMFVEVALLQRLTVFLGHPTYALTTILFSLLIASGLGSMASGKLESRFVPLLGLIGAVIAINSIVQFNHSGNHRRSTEFFSNCGCSGPISLKNEVHHGALNNVEPQ